MWPADHCLMLHVNDESKSASSSCKGPGVTIKKLQRVDKSG